MRRQSKGFGRCFASRIRSARPSRPATVRPVIARQKRINSSIQSSRPLSQVGTTVTNLVLLLKYPAVIRTE